MTTTEDDVEHQHPKRIANPQQKFIWVGDKKLKDLQKIAWDAGWWPKEMKSGIMWLAPDEVGQVAIHGSNSDRRAINNLTSEFRKAGLKI
jgi:hypothetical protein